MSSHKEIHNPFAKLINLIAGDHALLPLENRIFNILMALIVPMAFLGAYYNQILGYAPITVFPSVIGGIVGFAFYYISRFRSFYHNLFILVPAVMTVISIGIVFFFNAGSAGPMVILDLCFFMVFLLMSRGIMQYIIIGLLILHVILLYLIEFAYPEWVNPYKNPQERLSDLLITFSFGCLFLSLAVILSKRKYNQERRRVEFQNTELEKLNTRLSETLEEVSNKNDFIESLLKELNHRVKNNLQLVTSLLNRQISEITDPKTRESLNGVRNQIVSIGLIHQKLYHEHKELNLEISDYLKELCKYLIDSYRGEEEIKLADRLEVFYSNLRTAVHIGLIVNELITNSLKHAWQQIQANMNIEISTSYTQKTGQFLLIVKDNGQGFRYQERKANSSHGLDLIQAIANQYDGEVVLPPQKGTEVKVTLYLN